jgi:hypothetical protein
MAKPLLSPDGVLSYPKLLKPVLPRKPKPGDVPAYETTILFTVEQCETDKYKAMVAEAERVGREFFGDKFDALFKDGKLKWPFRKDIESSGYPATFHRFISARAKVSAIHPPPKIINRRGEVITSPMEIYPGVRARISVAPYAFSNESKGVSFGLRNVQILGKGARLDDSVEPGTEFDKLDDEPAGELSDELNGMLG